MARSRISDFSARSGGTIKVDCDEDGLTFISNMPVIEGKVNNE